MISFAKFKKMVLDAAKSIETLALLNTIIEGFLVMLIGGAMYVLTYIFTGEMIIVAEGISGLPTNVTNGMNTGIGMLLAGLQVMGIVFFVVGLVVVVRALLSIYGGVGGQGGKY
ncbi:MAG: hypothetical protein M0Q91_05145 [Methanoregula sp.]|jgi:hypothetical protein|nr:hypothetical protein [Methanoregula sp.]